MIHSQESMNYSQESMILSCIYLAGKAAFWSLFEENEGKLLVFRSFDKTVRGTVGA